MTSLVSGIEDYPETHIRESISPSPSDLLKRRSGLKGRSEEWVISDDADVLRDEVLHWET